MEKISKSYELQLQIIATGSHLSTEFGSTFREIEDDGFVIDRKIEILSKSDSAIGVANSMSLCLMGMANAFEELRPNIVLVLGDRSEILATVQAAMLCRIPAAHMCGGDVASGTYDNIIRHCITKIASLHFVTHKDAHKRVIQLGEDPERVFCFGSTCIDNIKALSLLATEDLESELGIKFRGTIFVVTFHPLTMGDNRGDLELHHLLDVVEQKLKQDELTVIFTKANADNGGRAVNAILGEFVRDHQNTFLFDSLGAKRYLSLVKQASLVIGNSSSGIYEAPYLGTATVDIGERQALRKAPHSVFRCVGSKDSIAEAISNAISFNFKNVEMVYGSGNASEEIVKVLRTARQFKDLSVKKFVDIEF
jgi:UDP-N-acetylglucosamine 2-epimerase (non-hydrolysing)/GDP/UDP-N,N'-diacetylbacillosamine 2-epimerase (hydrolysing)